MPVESEPDVNGCEENLLNLVLEKRDQSNEKSKGSFLIPTQARQRLQVLGNLTINGMEYKIYTGLPESKQIENNKLFEMVDSSCPCAGKSGCIAD